MHPDEYQNIIDTNEEIAKLDEQLRAKRETENTKDKCPPCKMAWPHSVVDDALKRIGDSINKKINDEEWHKILRDPNIGKVVERQWGYYKVLHEGDGYTVKELTILPGKSLSDQRHSLRNEHWLIVKGVLQIDLDVGGNKSRMQISTDNKRDYMQALIKAGTWHRPYNEGTEEVKVIETWIGNSSEEDIERRNV
tara:strand:+ start:720 stop:1301 length:582 start_codon:yes stop_codon:yes gene_type:complete